MADQVRVRKAEGTWVVRGGGAVIAETSDALELSEGDGEPVIYFSRDAVAMAFLEPSRTRTHRPHMGEATYWALQTKSVLIPDAAWSYETPNEDVAAIAGRVAFDAEKVAVEQI